MKQRYTLVELLVVIIIIGILAGLLIPAVGSARQTAKEHACASGCMNLMQALKSFESDYQKFPVDLVYSSGTYTPIGGGIATQANISVSTARPTMTASNTVLGYDYTLAILTGYIGGNGAADTSKVTDFGRNRKRTRYLEPPEEYLKACSATNGGYENGFYANAFGERYYLVFDSNGDKKMTFNVPNASGGTTAKTLVATVGVFCKVAAYDTTADSAWSKPERIATSWGGVVAAE